MSDPVSPTGVEETNARHTALDVAPVDRDLLLPSRFSEVAALPHLRHLLEEQVDMQMHDLRGLLALPMPEFDLEGGCNLTATALLCSVVAGASTLFFESSLDSVRASARRDSGTRFKTLMREYYPWQPGDSLEPEDAAELLYHEARNPLAHNLGVGKNRISFPGLPSGRTVMLEKGALNAAEITRLLAPDVDPPAPQTIARDLDTLVINVAALTWGVYRLLRDLFADPWQSALAEETARALRTGEAISYELGIGERDMADGRWGAIVSQDAYLVALGASRVIVNVPRSTRQPALFHEGQCGHPRRERVFQHLLDGQGGQYFWAADVGSARSVFRARRCFDVHTRPTTGEAALASSQGGNPAIP